MRPGQSLFETTSRALLALEPVLTEEAPDMVFVQGDTTTAFAGALAAFYRNIPIVHVEAGLRTGDLRAPFPEEMNRVLTGRLAALHLAATNEAAANLLREGVDAANVVVTGNSVIDALLSTVEGLRSGRLPAPALPWRDASRRLILVTAHRRENFGEGFEGICAALDVLARRDDVQLVYPVHPNPQVREVVQRRLSALPAIQLMQPLDYIPFVHLMQQADILLTDSGGVQEEGPSLGKPVLVMRNSTERPEAVTAGVARLVGTDPQRIVSEVELLLDNAGEYERRARLINPYGDGRAAERTRLAVLQHFGLAAHAAAANAH
jgi:UDP-N-acetylglucosamine 2-epimerase (non-hydrolysing)